MRVLFLILPFFLISINVYSQDPTTIKLSELGNDLYNLNHLNYNDNKKYITNKQIAGNPYFEKKFQKSYIQKIDGIEIKDILLRYNLYDNSMEYLKDGKVMIVLFPSEISRMNIAGNVFVCTKYMTQTNVSSGIFQLLYDGNYQLLKKDRVVIKLPSDKSDPVDSARFQRISPLYYVKYNNGPAHLINSQKILIRTLQPIPQTIIDFIKQNKINTKDERQLIDLMELIDQDTK